MTSILKQRIESWKEVLESLPEVTYIGNPILRQVASEVSAEEGKVLGEKLGQVLITYRNIAGYGRGFAAPQIGESKAVFVTFVNDELQIFINPKILEKSIETNFYKELCLSSGIMAADTERPEWIVMTWIDTDGRLHKEKFEGFLARLYQHEEAHLRGKINLDEAAPSGIELVLFDPLKEQLRKHRNE